MKLFYLHKGKVFEIRIGLEENLDAESNIAITNQLMVEDQLILIQKKNSFTIYEVRHDQNRGAALDEFDEGGGLADPDDFNPENGDDVLDLKPKCKSPHGLIEGTIHSIITTKDKCELVVIDQFNYYKINIETEFATIVKEQNVVSSYLIDEKYCYTLSHKTSHSKSGLRVVDIEQVNKNVDSKVISFFLQNAQVGI